MFQNQVIVILVTQLFSYVLTETSTIRSTNEAETAAMTNEFDHRIVNGRPAKAGEVPYQVSLGLEYYHKCGGSLVVSSRTAMQFVITAAHCVTDRKNWKPNHKPQDYYVRAGSVDVNKGVTVQVTDVVVFPGWKGDIGENDIALIFFRDQFTLSDDLYPIDLPDPGNSRQEKLSSITVSGWGAMKEDSHYLPTNLQVVQIPVVTRMACKRAYKKLYKQRNLNTNKVICAGYRKGGRDSCAGDSGGPAAGLDQRGKFLAGIVSYGHGCARPGIPGIYTKVSKYVDWINDMAAKSEPRPWVANAPSQLDYDLDSSIDDYDIIS